MTNQEILKLIETVDPNDSANLDEIDARVWCWLSIDGRVADVNGEKLGEWKFAEVHDHGLFEAYAPDTGEKEFCGIIRYSRSRDALKSIRPDGWTFNMMDWGNGDYGYTSIQRQRICPMSVTSPDLPTEELAELHAILQAIDFERNAK